MTNAFSTHPQAPGVQPARPNGLRTAAALACGALTGIVLDTVLSFINPFQGDRLPIDFPQMLLLTLGVGVVYAGLIISISVPTWRYLSKIKRNTAFDAVAVGFFSTAIVFNLPSILQPNVGSALRSIEISAMFGLGGAIAGAVTWAVGRSGASA